ncbi:Cytochrome b-c1 complex subunit Rieske, mitochondrial [Smittium culicis]|uniref:Cytochrome b-c1 complex subunit Rieske, mitochondrial n=1 Tax=Smittium culicis TaxID=133412 RepID=A0A1R1YCH2_9FUNG|nr:Cytochrome b-c1 complex subunit Rieske, mitochondrial [Smittium culicis]
MSASKFISSSKTFFTAPVSKNAFLKTFSAASIKANTNSNFEQPKGKNSPFQSSITNFTSQTNPLSQRRFKATWAAGPNSAKIPSFDAYTKDDSSVNTDKSKVFTYFMLGASGSVLASAAQSSVHGFLVNLAASADVLAVSKAEIDLSSIPLGESITIKWRGKPVFIRHRTEQEIQVSETTPMSELIDPQQDSERVQVPEWLIVVGVCTHLGCVPIKDAGDYGAYYCPCHGSHYDYSGRIRKGPAPLNLEVPKYNIDGNTVVIG